MRQVIIYSLLTLLTLANCSQPHNDFVIDKYRIIDIANNENFQTKLAVNKKKHPKISFPRNFYRASLHVYDKNDWSTYGFESSGVVKPTIVGNTYVVEIDNLPSKNYIFYYGFECCPPGGHMGIEFEIELK